jgi:hypothetical protein
VLDLALAEKQKGVSRVEAVLAEIARHRQELKEIGQLFSLSA